MHDEKWDMTQSDKLLLSMLEDHFNPENHSTRKIHPDHLKHNYIKHGIFSCSNDRLKNKTSHLNKIYTIFSEQSAHLKLTKNKTRI